MISLQEWSSNKEETEDIEERKNVVAGTESLEKWEGNRILSHVKGGFSTVTEHKECQYRSRESWIFGPRETNVFLKDAVRSLTNKGGKKGVRTLRKNKSHLGK